MRFSSETGQSTVEAAVLLPALFALLGLLAQPAIMLYTQCVMNSAACEACRLVATSTNDDASTRAFIERRLKAIPKLDIFHVDARWDIEWEGADSALGTARIKNRMRPLPLLGIAMALAGNLDASGCIAQKAEASVTPVSSWAREQGYAPSSWIGAWR